jgi:hypothetical protein
LSDSDRFIGQHKRDGDKINEKNKPEHQPWALREGLEIQKPRGEKERHGEQAKR